MIFDLILLAILLVSAVIAFFRGLIREVLTIMGVACGAIAAYHWGPNLKPLMRGWLGVSPTGEGPKFYDILPAHYVADGLAYGVIFITVVAALAIASHFLARGIRAVGLGAVDRTLGVFFGLARGMIIVVLLYMPFYLVTDRADRDELFEQYVGDSRTRIYVEAGAQKMASLVPKDDVKEAADKADEAANSIADDVREKMRMLDVLGGAAGKARDNKAETNKVTTDHEAHAVQPAATGGTQPEARPGGTENAASGTGNGAGTPPARGYSAEDTKALDDVIRRIERAANE